MPYGMHRFSDRRRWCLKIQKTTTAREPAPTNDVRINIGDVGFIRNGQFHLLFSAGCPLGGRQLGEDVPDTFEELTIGTPVFGQPRVPGCLRTDSVHEIGADLGASVSTTLYVLFLRPPSTDLKKTCHPGHWNLAQISHTSSLGTVVRHW